MVSASGLALLFEGYSGTITIHGTVLFSPQNINININIEITCVCEKG